MIGVLITHLFHVVSPSHGCHLLSLTSCFWFSCLFCTHSASLAWGLSDTSQERCTTTCCPSDAKDSPTLRPLVSKIKVSLHVANSGTESICGRNFFWGVGQSKSTQEWGGEFLQSVFPEAPSENVYLVQFTFSANYFSADLGLCSLLKILNQQS